MIHLDSIGFDYLINEIKEELINKKVNKIEQYTNKSFSIFFGKNKLNFVIKDNFAVMFTNTNNNIDEVIKTPFVLTLKKHLLSSFLVDIKQINNDRIILFTFAKVNHLGNREVFNLIFEIRSRNSDILLTNENNKILANILNSHYIEHKNHIGAIYSFNNTNNLISPYEVTENNFNLDNIKGLSKMTKSKQFSNYEEFKDYAFKYMPCVYTINDKNYLYITKIDEYENKIPFTTINKAINFYLNIDNSSFSLREEKNKIINKINNLIKKNNNILSKIKKDIEKTKNYEEIKIQAELLIAYSYMFKNALLNEVEVFNYYTNTNEIIKLDKRYSVIDNANLLYKKYNKMKNSIEILKNRYKEIENKNIYLEKNIFFVENENDYQGLDEIKEELFNEKKIVKSKKIPKRSLNVIQYKDASIYIGRNNKENDEITFKIANSNDIWLHVLNYPGSHVIVKNHNNDLEIIYKACEYAALNSKAPKNSKIEVDYCLKKYVKKIHSSNLGEVTYTNQKTMIVENSECN